MNRAEVFQILGIEQTKDEGAIKDAYRNMLTQTNPEDDPEGFKRLRAAYEEACRLARAGEDEACEERDTTPSGLWVEKVAAVYGNIRTRQSLERWEELFSDECFVSLEEEENCRLKLLRFLLDHFKLPTEVWKLLDKKLSIMSEASELREKFPADFVRYIISRCERGEDVDFSQFEGEEEADYDLFLRCYDRCWQALQEVKLEEAQKILEEADALKITHPIMEICRANLLRKQGRTNEAIEIMEGLCEKYPADSMICYNTAEMLWTVADMEKESEEDRAAFRERAAGIYRTLKEENESHYMANVRLTEWYYDKGQYKEAKDCAEKVLASGGDDAFMKLLYKVNAEIEKGLEAEYREALRSGGKSYEPALELCWCYLQDGKFSRGIRLAIEVEKQLPPEKMAEYNGLMAKLYVERAEYYNCLPMTVAWEEELKKKLDDGEQGEEKEKDKNRLNQAHLIRMQCYHNLGFNDKENFALAIEEGKQVLTNTPKDIGILLEMIQVYTEWEQYELGLELVRKLLDEYQIFAAYAYSLEIYRKQLSAGGVLREGAQCIRYFPNYVKAYEYMMKVYLDLEYKDDMQKLLEDAEKNGVKSVILDAYKFQATHKPMSVDMLNARLKNFRKTFRKPLEEGTEVFYEKGLPVVTEYVYHFPGSYMLVERALFHRAGHRYEEAKADFEKALSMEPANPYALNGLSFVYKYMGDYERALFYAKKAMLYIKEDIFPMMYSDMGNLYALFGFFDMAYSSYEEYEKLADGKETWHLENMAEFCAQMGQVERAEELYEKACVHSDRASVQRYYSNLAMLYMGSGMEESTRDVLNAWARSLHVERPANLLGVIRKEFSVHAHPSSEEVAYLPEYYNKEGWAELLFGSPQAAVKRFTEMVTNLNFEKNSKEGKLCDAVFACILCKDSKHGGTFAKQLKHLLDKHKFAGRDEYWNRQKALAQVEFLANYYTASDETLRQILDKGEKSEICHYCTNPVCKELAGMRALLLLKQGRQEEAVELVSRNLEIQPWDEYMLAVKHMALDREPEKITGRKNHSQS